MQLNTQITEFTGSLEKLTVPELIINIVGLLGGIFKIAQHVGNSHVHSLQVFKK